jgi:ribosomal-protein-serine acetyltransferase
MLRQALGDDIELRLYESRHAEEIFALVERNREHLGPWLWWVDQETSVDSVRAFIRTALRQFARGAGAHLGIWVEGAIAGGIGCRPIDWRNRATSIGYWIDSGQEGKGIVTRSCEAYLNYLFRELRLHRIEIRCATGNTRSCAVARRLGFTLEGTLRQSELVRGQWADMMVFSMLEQDWARRL